MINSFERFVSTNTQDPVINNIWISNITFDSLVLNWSGNFNKVKIDGNYYTKKRIIIRNNQTKEYSITPIINNIENSSKTKKIDFRYISPTPITGINSSEYTINNETGMNSYKNGQYIITSSSQGIQELGLGLMKNYYAFDNNENTYWLNNFKLYTPTQFNTELQPSSPSWVDGSRNVYGEWLQIKLPYRIQLFNYNIVFYNEYISNKFYIAGSINGTNWDALDYRTNNPSLSVTVNLNNLKTYSYFRFISNINDGNNPKVISVKNWYLNGIYIIS